MIDFSEKIKQYLHDPPDKYIDIKTHIQRAKRYSGNIGVSGVEKLTGPDQTTPCMVRSLLPKDAIMNKEEKFQELNEIRHPLSKGYLCLNISDEDRKTLLNLSEASFKSIAYELPREDKERFFYLWRNLSEIFKEKLTGHSFKEYLYIIPADTRIPDHSIWEHLKITSAINAFEQHQANSLFLFTLGPVQSFIEQARKTQDLFMGSFLLSYLTFVAIERLTEEVGPTNIIYPDLFRQPLVDFYLERKIKVKNSTASLISQPTIPNRFVAILPYSEEKEIKDLAEELEKSVRTHWQEIVSKVLETFSLKNEINEHVIQRQTDDFPQIYWAALPLRNKDSDVMPLDFEDFFTESEIKEWAKRLEFTEEKGEHSPNVGLLYQLTYSALERILGARKNLRDFYQTEEHGKKCHLCGEKEAVVRAGKGTLNVGKYISTKETLCVMCFTKRALDKYIGLDEVFGEKFKDFSFPSTSEIATTCWKVKAFEVAGREYTKYLEAFINLTKGEIPFTETLPKIKEKIQSDKNIDGYWFFENNLRKEEFKEVSEKIEFEERDLEELKKKLKDLTKKAGAPPPYYGIVLFDGDNMGSWLSGEALPSIEYAYNSSLWDRVPKDFKDNLKTIFPKKPLTPAIHSAVSTALKNFSIELVRKIIEEDHHGRLIYSGGDDVLAFVAVQDLFDVMRKLRAAFSGQIEIKNGLIEVNWSNTTGFVKKDDVYLLTMGNDATASCGAVVAHYKIPLTLVLRKVREMEQKAKYRIHGKDAFGIALLKHSGQIREFICKWQYSGVDIIAEMKDIGSGFTQNASSLRLAKGFIYKLHENLKMLKDKESRLRTSENLFKVELRRLLLRSVHDGEEHQKRQWADLLTESLMNIFSSPGIEMNLDRFLNFLEITRFLHTEGIGDTSD